VDLRQEGLQVALRRAPFLIGLLVALVAAAVAIEIVRDRTFPPAKTSRDLLYVRSGAFLGKAALSYDALLADVYWIRAIQHFGGTRRSSDPTKNYDLLYPLLDITTTLDPYFNIAYRFGAIFLAEPFPGGAGQPALALTLLQKGMKARPDRWQYLQDAGFVCYWSLGDFKTAAAWFEKASEIPGAPWWLRSMAAVTRAEGGDRRGSRQLWQQILETADNEWLGNEAARRLVQLDALDQIDQLQAIVAAFTRETGRRPWSWADLVQAGLLRGIPLDPTGIGYVLDPQTGAVTVARESKLYPLPTEPKGL
jgi:tetratricopeptide (TPR) repeat protein